MASPRPFFLNLVVIHLPVGGFVSILHRATGAVLSLLIPALLWVFALSLRSPEDFEAVLAALHSPLGWLIGTGLTWALLHHLFAGLRHLGFDFGWGESRDTARKTAWLTLGLAIGISLILALWRLA